MNGIDAGVSQNQTDEKHTPLLPEPAYWEPFVDSKLPRCDLSDSNALDSFHLFRSHRLETTRDALDCIFLPDQTISPGIINASRYMLDLRMRDFPLASHHKTGSLPVAQIVDHPTQDKHVIFQRCPAPATSENPALDARPSRKRYPLLQPSPAQHPAASLQLSEPFLRVLAHARLAIAPPSAPCSIPPAVPWQRLATLPSSSVRLPAGPSGVGALGLAAMALPLPPWRLAGPAGSAGPAGPGRSP